MIFQALLHTGSVGVQVAKAASRVTGGAQTTEQASESGKGIGVAAKDTAVGLDGVAKKYGVETAEDLSGATAPAKGAANELIGALKVRSKCVWIVEYDGWRSFISQ